MIKKISALTLALSLCGSVALAALPVPENGEVIEMNVESVELNELKKSKFEKIDLRPYANRAFADNVEGDMTGGWSDQGPENDMRNFDLYGDVEILGIPFDIIPQGENGGKSVLAIRGKDNMELPKRVEIPYNKKTAGVYFLQSAPFAFSSGHWVGRYSFEYTDGTIAYTDVLSAYQISDFFGSSVPQYGKTAWLGDNKFANANGYRINLSMFALKNPHPDKDVKNLVIETEGNSSFIMIVGLTFTDKGPYYLQDGEIALNPATHGWKKYASRDSGKVSGSALDVSYILDAPAGKHGCVSAKGDGFVYADGTKAKFWGTNISGKANFPEKKDAEKLAEEIAQNGFNMVRMTNLDGDFEGNIFAGNTDTSTLDAESMDKLCYFIKCLKDRGVYVYLTITSQRPVLEGDGIENPGDITAGYKVEGFFDQKLIDLQKDYLKKLLSHKNKYTGITFAEDPAIAVIEYMDSNSMFLMSSNPRAKYGVSTGIYRDTLNKKYNDFLIRKYHSDSNLKKAWKDDYGFTEDRSLRNGAIEFDAAWKESPIMGVRHKADIAEFFAMIHKDYYNEMESVSRKCGYKGVTSCHSNGENSFEYGDIISGADSDFVSVNAFNSVNTGIGTSSNPAFYDKGLGFADDIVKSKIANIPLMVSGYNTGFGGKFSGDSILAMASLSGQQGWSACQYYFTDGEDNTNNAFEIENDLARLGLMPAAAILYSGMDELDSEFTFNLPLSAIIPSEFENTQLHHMFDKKVSVSSDKKIYANHGVNDNDKKYTNKSFKYDADEKVYSIRTNNTEACVGVLAETEAFDHINYHFGNSVCAVSLSALDGKTLDTAERFLLTTAGRSRRSDMFVDEWFNISGSGDMVTEPITGSFVLKIGDVRVYALDFSGQRLWEMPQLKDSQGNTVVPVSRENSSVYYEIVKIQEN